MSRKTGLLADYYFEPGPGSDSVRDYFRATLRVWSSSPAGVAQLVEASDLGSEGSGFESLVRHDATPRHADRRVAR